MNVYMALSKQEALSWAAGEYANLEGKSYLPLIVCADSSTCAALEAYGCNTRCARQVEDLQWVLRNRCVDDPMPILILVGPMVRSCTAYIHSHFVVAGSVFVLEAK